MNKLTEDKEKIESGYSVTASRNVSIWLDSYDDIFSDFDPRPYSERNISDDFIDETKKFYSEKESDVQLFILLMPEARRNKETEAVIIKRLNHYFKKNYQNMLVLQGSENRKGILFLITGILMMIIAGYISLIKSGDLLLHTLFVIFEPAGWFLMWVGFDTLLHYSKKEKPEVSLFNKMTKSKISFNGF